MNKLLYLFIIALVLSSCSTVSVVKDANCPDPPKDKDGYVLIERGVTLKCQIKQASDRMSCIAWTKEGSDGWICDNGEKIAMFFFDENEVLTNCRFSSYDRQKVTHCP